MPQPPHPVRTPGIMYVQKGHPSDLGFGTGWLVYAILMLLASAGVNAVWGIVAIADDAYWGGDTLVSGHGVLFGWVWIGFALADVLVAGLVAMRSRVGLSAAIAIAVLNIAGHVSALDAFPGWALLALGANLLAIYALVKVWVVTWR